MSAKRTLILASASPARRQLLQQLGLPFQAVAADIDESRLPAETVPDMVLRLAGQKAAALVARFPDALIIGSDQIAADEDDVLYGKPGSRVAGEEQLRRLSGRAVIFHSGLAVLDSVSGLLETAYSPCTARFRQLSDARIEHYLNHEDALHCAGSIRTEGLGIALVEAISSDDPSLIMGMSLIQLVSLLERQGCSILGSA